MALQLPAKTIGLVVVNYTVCRDTANHSFFWWDSVLDKKNGDFYQLVDVGIDMFNKQVNAYIFDDNALPTGFDDLGTPLATEKFDLEDPVPGLAKIFADIALHFRKQGLSVDNYAIKYHGHGGINGIFGYNTEQGSSGLILESNLEATT
ncbi:MAG: hypothetical protein AAF492_29800, partial [Verrucomicrobiota bacterium]